MDHSSVSNISNVCNISSISNISNRQELPFGTDPDNGIISAIIICFLAEIACNIAKVALL
ncbi:MAG TPA: hypothetical protein DD727_05340 [Clostridiales bacterium]|nr:hypothetical protein [Clostridiales bacterium]